MLFRLTGCNLIKGNNTKQTKIDFAYLHCFDLNYDLLQYQNNYYVSFNNFYDILKEKLQLTFLAT